MEISVRRSDKKMTYSFTAFVSTMLTNYDQIKIGRNNISISRKITYSKVKLIIITIILWIIVLIRL